MSKEAPMSEAEPEGVGAEEACARQGEDCRGQTRGGTGTARARREGRKGQGRHAEARQGEGQQDERRRSALDVLLDQERVDGKPKGGKRKS